LLTTPHPCRGGACSRRLTRVEVALAHDASPVSRCARREIRREIGERLSPLVRTVLANHTGTAAARRCVRCCRACLPLMRLATRPRPTEGQLGACAMSGRGLCGRGLRGRGLRGRGLRGRGLRGRVRISRPSPIPMAARAFCAPFPRDGLCWDAGTAGVGLGRSTWQALESLRRRLLRRGSGKCSGPGCAARGNLNRSRNPPKRLAPPMHHAITSTRQRSSAGVCDGQTHTVRQLSR